MGTGTFTNVKVIIEGRLSWDYEDTNYLPEIVKAELALVCAKYGLTLNYEED